MPDVFQSILPIKVVPASDTYVFVLLQFLGPNGFFTVINTRTKKLNRNFQSAINFFLEKCAYFRANVPFKFLVLHMYYRSDIRFVDSKAKLPKYFPKNDFFFKFYFYTKFVEIKRLQT